MRWAYLFASVGLGLAALISGLRRSPPETRPLPPHEVEKLATLKEPARRELLAEMTEKTRKGKRVPQVLLVQLAEAGKVIVIEVTPDDVSDEDGATGWTIPWGAAAEVIRTEPAGKEHTFGSYSGVAYRHEIYPVSRDDGLYLLVNSGDPPRPWSAWRTGAWIASVVLLALAWRTE